MQLVLVLCLLYVICLLLSFVLLFFSFLFFFNDTATTEIYTLSLHDALPICVIAGRDGRAGGTWLGIGPNSRFAAITNRRGSAPKDGIQIGRAHV